MPGRNDIVSIDWLLGATINATGALQFPGNPNPFAHMDLLGMNGFSLTIYTPSGSTATGTLNVQCTDSASRNLFDPNVPWVNMNYPNTSTPVAITIASGTNAQNIQVFGCMTKYIRLRFSSTGGTGTLNAGITCRANSR